MNTSQHGVPLKLCFFAGESGLDAITSAWRKLLGRCSVDHGFVHDPSWYRAFLKIASFQKDSNKREVKNDTVFFLTLWEKNQPADDDDLVAVIPLQLCQQRLFGITVHYAQLAYNHELAWCDILSSIDLKPHRRLIETAIKEKFPRVSICRWQDLPETSHAFQSGWLSRQGSRWSRFNRFLRKNSERYSLDVYTAIHRKKLVKNIERHQRKLEKLGEVSVAFEKATCHNADALFNVFADIEHKNWKGKEKSSLRSMPERWSFYRSVTQAFSSTSPVEASELLFIFLAVDHKAIAAQMAVKTPNGIMLLKIGYDEDFAQYGPGNILLLNVLKQLQCDGVKNLSFVTGRDWMRRWHPQKEALYMCYQAPSFFHIRDLYLLLLGFSYLWVQQLKAYLRKLKQVWGSFIGNDNRNVKQ